MFFPKKRRAKSGGVCKKTPEQAKSKKASVFLRNALLMILVAVFCFSGYKVADLLLASKQNKDVANDMQSIFKESYAKQDVLLDFSGLSAVNPEIKGWLRIDDTPVDYPVCQAKNNTYYLTHDPNKNNSIYGALFFDCNQSIETGKILTIHGHHMKNGSMFACLTKYRSPEYCMQHPTVNLYTETYTAKYAVFAAYIVNIDKKDYNGQAFDYVGETVSDAQKRAQWLEEIKSRTLVDTKVTAAAEDDFLVLATCTYEYKNARFVVVARKLHENEEHIELLNEERIKPSK